MRTLTAKPSKSRKGCHGKASVADAEDAGEGDHAGPAGGSELGLGTGLVEPAPEDPVAVLIQLGLGRVEGMAVVELAGGGGLKAEGGGGQCMSPQTEASGLYWWKRWYWPRKKIGAQGSFIQLRAGR